MALDMAHQFTMYGYHIRGCCPEVPGGVMEIARDALGNVTSMKGISAEMIEWMSRAFNLTHECVNVYKQTHGDTSAAIGSVDYATRDLCDVIVAPTILLRYDRYQLLDFIHPWLMEPVVMLIPTPIFVSDSSTFFKPFSLTVWVALVCSIFFMIATLMLLDYFKGLFGGHKRSPSNLNWLFIIGSLFGQGGFGASNKTRIRILIVSWLFGTFALVGLYSSQLFGYVLTNIPEPIVKSAEELADKPNVDLLVVDHLAVDIAISKSADALMKKLAKKLDQNSKKYRCLSIPDCIEQVKKSKRPSVFIHGSGPISNVMMNDFRQTGQCNYALAQKSFIDSFAGSWMVRKGDRNTEFYNKATMRMHESGLINHWQDIYQPKPYKCLEMSKQKENDRRSTAKITLKNLAIPFGMLAVGFIVAFIALICEKMFSTCGFNKIQKKRSYISTGLVL